MTRPADLPPSNHYASTEAAKLSQEYVWLWSQLAPGGPKQAEADRAAQVALDNKGRYQSVADATKAPWFFIAAIHYREASQSWRGCLHNGDPWNQVTVHVPAGRGPWNSWEEAAVDALQYEGYANLHDWTCGDVFRRLEFYNGRGYRIGGVKNFVCHKHGNRVGTFDGIYHGSMQDTTPRNASPYVYSGTPYYAKGVSIEDHSFYPDAVDGNVGVMLFLKTLESLAGEQWFGVAQQAGVLLAAPAAVPADARGVLHGLGAQAGMPAAAIDRMFDLQAATRPGRLPRFWAACDFSKRSDAPRFHVFDRIAETLSSHLCAHGEKSEARAGSGMASRFSNVPESHESCLGIFRCAETYIGRHGRSLRIDGLEPTNSNARARLIVIHSAPYVSEAAAHANGRVGCSDGCFALSEDDAQGVIEFLQGGSLLIAIA